MARRSAFLMLLFALVPAAAVSQSIPSPFCNAGLYPDGYVDFSKLPQPPTTGGGSSAPYTVTLPSGMKMLCGEILLSTPTNRACPSVSGRRR
jgi:hypothetical protein